LGNSKKGEMLNKKSVIKTEEKGLLSLLKRGEGQKVEFKSRIDDGLGKPICSFANTNNGLLEEVKARTLIMNWREWHENGTKMARNRSYLKNDSRKRQRQECLL